MKKQNIIKNLLALAVMGTLVSCNDFLDKGPLSEISPDKYLTDETQLSSFANGLYPKIISTHGYGYGRFGVDKHTDNQAADTYSNLFVPGEWKTAQVGGDWDFTNIYQCNYFLNTVLPRWEEESISGLKANVEHYIGEVYFLRALEYFNRYRTFGDFPIVTETLPDNAEVLVAASKRAPRTEVARFILADLDKAIELMSGVSVTKRTQISKEAAILLKSRVALYEGTWLKYFKGTAFVPTGEGWPGSEKEYNKNYQFQSGSIDEEIKFFLKTSMEAATLVAKTFTLVDNTAQVQQDPSEAPNPYMDMFGSVDLSAYDEVLLWREYSKALGVTHNIVVAAQFGNYAIGLTRGMVNSFFNVGRIAHLCTIQQL